MLAFGFLRAGKDRSNHQYLELRNPVPILTVSVELILHGNDQSLSASTGCQRSLGPGPHLGHSKVVGEAKSMAQRGDAESKTGGGAILQSLI